MKVADAIAQWLQDKNITCAFGVIGAGNLEIWNAITRLQKTRIVCQHHEQACVMAAGAYYRISGRISVALITTGAGSTNAITGVASCYMDSTPVIVISGNEASKYMREPTRVLGVQGYPSMEVVKPLAKLSVRPMLIEIPSTLRFAYDIALAPRQGPCYVDIPKDYQSAAV